MSALVNSSDAICSPYAAQGPDDPTALRASENASSPARGPAERILAEPGPSGQKPHFVGKVLTSTASAIPSIAERTRDMSAVVLPPNTPGDSLRVSPSSSRS